MIPRSFFYPKLKVDIDNLKLDLEEEKEIVSIIGTSDSEKASSSNHSDWGYHHLFNKLKYYDILYLVII